MKERLKYILELYGINQTQFANRIGVTKGAISHIMVKGDGEKGGGFKAETIEKIISSFPSVTKEWLINGIGDAPLIAKMPVPRQTSLFDDVSSKADNNNVVKNVSATDDSKTNEANMSSVAIDTESDNTSANSRDNSTINRIPVRETVIEQSKEKRIRYVLIMYTDGTFSEFTPE